LVNDLFTLKWHRKKTRFFTALACPETTIGSPPSSPAERNASLFFSTFSTFVPSLSCHIMFGVEHNANGIATRRLTVIALFPHRERRIWNLLHVAAAGQLQLIVLSGSSG
jgi:hypothetical protein